MWIKTIPPEEDPVVAASLQRVRGLYPIEYATPVNPNEESITMSHTLIPKALEHAFSTFGVLMNEELPLSRAQHEMIATVVSATNRCHY